MTEKSDLFNLFFMFHCARTWCVHELAFEAGQRKPGVRFGPKILMENSSPEILGNLPFALHASPQIALDDFGSMAKYFFSVQEKLYRSLEEGNRLINLGGDHGILMPILSALLKWNSSLRVLYLDAHADLNSPATSPSGSFHGMPLGFFTGSWKPEEEKVFTDLKTGVLESNQVFFLGLRDIDPHEKMHLQEKNFWKRSSAEWMQAENLDLIREINNLGDPDAAHPWHISIDLDLFDPQIAPATGVPVDGGMGLQKVLNFLEIFKEQHKIVSFDLVELNPELALSDNHLSSSAHCLLECARVLRNS